MNADKKAVLDKIRKLFNMANHATANEHEAANATKMAESLLRKHNLSMGDVTPEEAKSDILEGMFTEMKWTAGKAPVWVMNVIIGVANAHDCFIVWRRASTNDHWVAKSQSHLTFIGAELDVAVAMETFKYLYHTVIKLTDSHFNSFPAPRGKARTEKNSYRLGMANRLYGRLNELAAEKKEEFEAATTGTSLVIVKKDAIADYLGGSATYGTSTRQSRTSASSYAAGHSRGGSVSLNKQLK